jgi:V/A-type H+-transporting ATPase subunit D
MKNFMAIIREAKNLREQIEKELGSGFFSYIFFSSKIRHAAISENLSVPTKEVTLNASTQNIMGVEVPKFEYQEKGDFLCYDLATTSTSLDRALETFSNALKTMVRLAEIEHSAKLLAAEIEKTRRRVNALEYVFIPDMQETIKYITAKLNEQERATIITLMKVKDIIANQEAAL